MIDSDITPEVPEPNYEQVEEAFKESLGPDFDKASIIEGSQPLGEELEVELERRRAESILFSMRHIGTRDHRVAGVLAIALGMFGMHKFYMGYHTQGFTMLLITALLGMVTFGGALLVVWLVAIAEGINYFSTSQPEFERTYIDGTQKWF